ncbi:hypothetical protein AQUCO_01500002v1 [Aquilegia coerulea]|uniref:ABC1 atypical kinase-like domain-containing protein n=1 Tax=Aquilegia coerulea TaxID=218851 RepID=A0A2G5DRN9_AQUCA|nr:hypothetical protein AQUCO_01500002v1 [Aquilegia coerulea]
MFRFSTFQKFRRVGNLFSGSHCSEVKKNSTLVRCSNEILFDLIKGKQNLYNTRAHNFSFTPRRNIMTHSWKMRSQTRSYCSPSYPPTAGIFCSTKWALTRFHPVTLGIYAFIARELTQTRWQGTGGREDLHVGYPQHMNPDSWRDFLTSSIFLVLEPFVLFMRAIYLGILFSPTIAMAPFAESFGVEFRKTWIHLVRVTLEKAGPAFIAWGQWAATRLDLFPKDLCVELSKLQAVAPEHSFAYTKNTIEKAFGRKLPEIFDDFEEAPVASGSVVQVHRATLRFRYPNTQIKPIAVAVKVRHPGIKESIKRDFFIIESFAKIMNLIPALKWLRLDERVQQVATLMMSEVDLTKKAELLGRFGYNFDIFKGVSFPKPLHPLLHPAVLVETDEKGKSLSCYIDDGVELDVKTRKKLVTTATFALLNMLTADMFIFAGMHPGNLLLRVDKGKPHLVFLDVGLTAHLSKSEAVNLVELFKAVGRRDGQTAAKHALSLSEKQTCPYPDAFIEDVKESIAFWDTEEGGVINPYECMNRLVEKVRLYKVNIDDNVHTAMLTVLALEGWERKIYLESLDRVMPKLHCFCLESDGWPWSGTQYRSERGRKSYTVLD